MGRHCLMFRRWIAAGASILLYLLVPAPSPAAECTFVFLPMEEAKYLLKGTGCEGIAAVNFTLDYDEADLSSPQVSVMGGKRVKEEGTMSSSGRLDVEVVRENPTAGYFEACIWFEKRESYPAVINFVTAEVVDPSGIPRPVAVEMVLPHPAMNEPDPVEASPAPATAKGRAAPVPMEEGLKPVFERFRDHAGEKSMPALTALFAGAPPCCRQTPAVVISDGRQIAEIAFTGIEEGRLRQMKGGAPLVTVQGGELLSVKRGKEAEEWIATVRPFEGWWEVRVSCTAAEETIDFPLTVAPVIDMPRSELVDLGVKTFGSRLRSFLDREPEPGKPQSAVWFREYLFSANYLAAREERERASVPAAAKGRR